MTTFIAVPAGNHAVKAAPDLPADLDKATNKVWAQMQEELSQLSTHGTPIIAKGNGHCIQDRRPNIVIEAVHNVVNRAPVNQPHGRETETRNDGACAASHLRGRIFENSLRTRSTDS